MTDRGHVENGRIVFDENVELQEGMQVRIEVTDAETRTTLADRFRDIIGQADDLPEDMAEQHDHYIHGTPKR